ncbi:MAG: DUF302 domain-containing protein [Candidatus Rokubacteria bacterium]|nr:DUF302 domain-containing protein [Candidatus Rokubacteria bacterium]MBI3107443.1 DUF302 domain-containing protein [Candidatus Rokubacteria bacterium]
MLHIIESKKSMEQLSKDLEAAVVRHKFGVLGVHDLQETMAKKGVEFARQCRIFEVCNPHQAKKVLEANLEISTALPCRISAYEEGGGTRLATIKPTAMIALYPNPELRGVAEEVERTLEAIMAEAAG